MCWHIHIREAQNPPTCFGTPCWCHHQGDLTVVNAGKGKSVPLQAWSGPESSWKLRFPDFMTTTQGAGKVVSLTHRPHLPPGNSPGTHFS